MARRKYHSSPEAAIYTDKCRQWNGKPYYSLDCFLRKQYGEKIYKVAIDGGMGCPNRDGTKGTGGCTFCSEGGSGEFAVPRSYAFTSVRSGSSQNTGEPLLSGIVTKQLNEGITRLKSSQKFCGRKYIAYFQAFSNTYAPIEYLRSLYQEAIAHPDTAVLSIATRPDCFSPEIYDLLSECQQKKPVWIELGLQTMHDRTAKAFHRGYPLSCYENTVCELKKRGIPVITHVILGLPGESKADMLQTIQYLNHQRIDGIKLQLLHILKGTPLARDLKNGLVKPLTKNEYVDILLDCITHLSQDIVIHRLTGDGPKDLLLAPQWSLNKREILNYIAHQMKIKHLYQGCRLVQ